MNDLRVRADSLSQAAAAGRRLIEVSCPKRQARAQTVNITALVVTTNASHAVASSSDGFDRYCIHIRHTPYRAWKCTCPDATQRGIAFGPCKHAIAVARATLTAANTELAALVMVLTTAP
jgi:uncharacterized Zn finger protein